MPADEEGIEITVDSLFAVFTLYWSPQTCLKSIFECITNELGIPSEYILLVGNSSFSIDDGQSTLEALGIEENTLLVLKLRFTITVNGENRTLETESCRLGRDLYFAIVRVESVYHV